MIVVEFHSLADFIEELRFAPETIADKVVRFQIAKTPEQVEQVSFEVSAWATAVKNGDEKYLLEFMAKVGRDQLDADDESGSQAAEKLKSNLTEHCDDMGMRVGPGKIEPF